MVGTKGVLAVDESTISLLSIRPHLKDLEN